MDISSLLRDPAKWPNALKLRPPAIAGLHITRILASRSTATLEKTMKSPVQSVQYFVRREEMNRLLNLLHTILRIRITFFDARQHEIHYVDMTKRDSAYCAFRRRTTTFNRKCIECDKRHLREAREQGSLLVYRCHDGLIEGLVPLFDEKNIYLGALCFGQIREKGSCTGARSGKSKTLFQKLPSYTFEYATQIGELISHICDYILVQNIISAQKNLWVEQAFTYIQHNISRKITLRDLAVHIHKSESFLSHAFRKEFGMSAKQFIMHERMLRAQELLRKGNNVVETARKLGFFDEFHFSRTFKKHFGRNPSEVAGRAVRGRGIG